MFQSNYHHVHTTFFQEDEEGGGGRSVLTPAGFQRDPFHTTTASILVQA